MLRRQEDSKIGVILAMVFVAVVSVIVFVQPVLAALSYHWDATTGTVVITSDAADNITLACEDGRFTVNGNHAGPFVIDCADILKIIVNGGPGNNEIDASGVTKADFTNLADYQIEMHGGAGDDILNGSEFADIQYGDQGHDHMYGGDGNDQQHGGDGNDLQFGGNGEDYQYGDDGNDRQHGGEDGDIQEGGPGFDQQWGDAGNDRQMGGLDNDAQDGGEGNDIQYGDHGDDDQVGGAGDDVQNGGTGKDTQFGDDGADTQYGNDGVDSQYGGAGNDKQYGGKGDDVQDGEAGNDQQHGGGGDDWQFGRTGNDTQYGGDGDDSQSGGEGEDTLWGQAGDDSQSGGEGGDKYFLFFGSADVIHDEAGNDTLDASVVTSEITINIDLQDVDQVVDSAGNILRLQGVVENFIGGLFVDTVFAGPLLVPRHIDGGSTPSKKIGGTSGANSQFGNILYFDAKGMPVTDTGTSLIIEGYSPVTYRNFTVVNIVNSPLSIRQLYLPWQQYGW